MLRVLIFKFNTRFISTLHGATLYRLQLFQLTETLSKTIIEKYYLRSETMDSIVCFRFVLTLVNSLPSMQILLVEVSLCKK